MLLKWLRRSCWNGFKCKYCFWQTLILSEKLPVFFFWCCFSLVSVAVGVCPNLWFLFVIKKGHQIKQNTAVWWQIAIPTSVIFFMVQMVHLKHGTRGPKSVFIDIEFRFKEKQSKVFLPNKLPASKLCSWQWRGWRLSTHGRFCVAVRVSHTATIPHWVPR